MSTVCLWVCSFLLEEFASVADPTVPLFKSLTWLCCVRVAKKLSVLLQKPNMLRVSHFKVTFSRKL